MTSDTDERWFRSRLTPYAAGLLDTDEQQRFESLLDASDAYKDMFEEFLALEPSSVSTNEHLPRSMIDGWAHIQPGMSGLMRELVDDHLARCESCRAALVARGHAVDAHPAVEESPAVRRQDAVRPTLFDHVREWRLRLTATWAVAATAAAFLLLLAPGVGDGPGPEGAALPFALVGTQRDGASQVRIPPGTRGLTILLEAPWELKLTESATAELLDPEGTAVASVRGTVASMVRPRGVLVFQLAEPLTTGRYTLRVTSEDRPDVSAERTLDVTVAEPTP